MNAPADQSGHPAPHRDKVAVPWLLADLALPSSAWTLQLIFAYGLSSNACPLTPNSTETSGGGGEATVLIALQLVCLVAAVASGVMSLRHWRRVRGEKQDSEHSHLTLGEGRTRFLAMAGMLSAGIFAVAITFNLLEPILIPSCWSLR